MTLTSLSRLSFGLAKPTGGCVDDLEWQTFRDDVIAATFGSGFTVYAADGGWRDNATGQTIREPSMILEVAHDGSDEALGAVRIVALTYKALFQQDAVMVTTLPCNVEFV